MPDDILETIARYVVSPPPFSTEAYATARYCLGDALGCAILALQYPACTRLLGPTVPGTTVEDGCRVPGTAYVLDPVCAAFNLGAMIRWLDYNDTWLAAEWGHPSDNIGALLPVSEYISRRRMRTGKAPLKVRDLLTAMIQAYEIQGGLALLNSFNRVGFDHVIFVKAASAAVSAHMLGGGYEAVLDTLSQVWADNGPLRFYRHAPNAGSRKSWAAGDAASRGVWLALLTMRGERGYATPLSAPKWGLYDVLFRGKPFELQRPLGCYVMENILFKIAFPAEFHAQTAVEAAFHLHPLVKGRWEDIEAIDIKTHESAVRIIDKQGALRNPADRDHCLQYMTAIGLLKGTLTADDYEDKAAQDPWIDKLRAKMRVREEAAYSSDYHHPDKRSIANAIEITFKDGSSTGEVAVEYPVGHRKRRAEGVPLLLEKLRANLRTRYSPEEAEDLAALFGDEKALLQMPVPELSGLFH